MFHTIAFVGVTIAHQMCVRYSNTRGGRVKIANSFSAKQTVNMLNCLNQNKHVFFHLFFAGGAHLNDNDSNELWGQKHRNEISIIAFLNLTR